MSVRSVMNFRRQAAAFIASALILPAARAGLTDAERDDIASRLSGASAGAPREVGPPRSSAPDFRPANAPKAAPVAASYPEPGRKVRDNSFATLDVAALYSDERVEAGGARSDLGGRFERGMGGVILTVGYDYDLSKSDRVRFGAEIGYFADHVPWGVAAAGEALYVAAAVRSGDSRSLSNLDDLPSPYYRLKTEGSRLPLSLFGDYVTGSRDGVFRVYAGPLVGVTTEWYSASYGGETHNSGGVAPHFGAHAGMLFAMSRTSFFHLGYEWRHTASARYSPGFDLRFSDRDSHQFQIGMGGSF